jgi:hypothetical protein
MGAYTANPLKHEHTFFSRDDYNVSSRNCRFGCQGGKLDIHTLAASIRFIEKRSRESLLFF